MTRETLLQTLKTFVEVQRPRTEWENWWRSHFEEIESDFDRFTYLLLKHRGLGGAIDLLEKENVEIKMPEHLCRKCGELLFIAMPDVTTREEIRNFALRCTFEGREEVARDGWIHPGKYCPNGCTQVLWHIKRTEEKA